MPIFQNSLLEVLVDSQRSVFGFPQRATKFSLPTNHHHRIFYLPHLHNTKNLITAVIARRRGDPGSHLAYGKATSLKLINEVKKKCCECAARPIQRLFK